MAKIRIVDANFYFASPINGLDALTSEFRGTQTSKVPIIRIFGATDDGHKACLHVHGVFPYIYIPHDGKEHHESLRYKLANAIDKTLNVALGQAASKTQHVYKINFISGIPYYGYHSREHQFFKIFFYNPHLMKKVCTFLESGTILGRIYQPHEAHIPYIQQFMIDYNLHGMSFIQLSEIYHRRRNSCTLILTNPGNYLPDNIGRVSRSDWECDTRADCILNVQDVSPNAMTNPGIAAIWADERQRRIDLSLDSQVSHILTQNRKDLEPTQSHIVYKHKLEERLLSSECSKLEIKVDDANVSVYPAETPESGELLSGGFESFDGSYVEIKNENEAVDDTDCQKLYVVLLDLAEANDIAQNASIPEDSILSQLSVANVNANEDIGLNDEEENELDLSMPLENTPVKQQSVMNSGSRDALHDVNDLYFINIPQLDGTYDLRSRSIKTTSSILQCNTKSRITKNQAKDGLKMVINNARKERVNKKTVGTVSNLLDTKRTLRKVIQSIVTSSNQGNETKFTKELIGKCTSKMAKKHCEIFIDRNIQKTSKTTNTQIIPPYSQSSKHVVSFRESSRCRVLEKSNKNSRTTRSNVPLVDVNRLNVHNPQVLSYKCLRNGKILSLDSNHSSKVYMDQKLQKQIPAIADVPQNIENSVVYQKISRKSKSNHSDESSNLIFEHLNKQTSRSTKITRVQNITFKNDQKRERTLKEVSPNVPKFSSTVSNLSRRNVTVEKFKLIPVSSEENKNKEIKSSNKQSSCAKKVIEQKANNFTNCSNVEKRRSNKNKKSAPGKIGIAQSTVNNTKIVPNFDALKLNEIEVCELIVKDESISANATHMSVSHLPKKKSSIKTRIKRPLNKTVIVTNCDTSNKVAMLEQICAHSFIATEAPDPVYPPKNTMTNTCLASIETIANRHVVSKGWIETSCDTSVNLEINDEIRKNNTTFLHPVKGLPDFLPEYIPNECKSVTKTIVKPQYNVIKRKLRKTMKGYKEVSPFMKENEVSPHSAEFCDIFYKYPCTEDSLDGESIKSRIRKIKTNTKCYKEVSIEGCLNGRIPCNHNKTQFHENKNEIGTECTKNICNTKLKNMPLLNCGPLCSPQFQNLNTSKAILMENVTLNGLTLFPKPQKCRKKMSKKSKLGVVEKQELASKMRMKKLNSQTLRYRKKLRSKRMEEEVQKDMAKYIALQTGKKPKFNIVFGRRFPVLPLNICKVKYNQFPNTEWSHELMDELQAPKVSDNIVILKHEKLPDHEKCDLSSLFSETSPLKEAWNSSNANNNNSDNNNNNNNKGNDLDSILYPLDALDYNESLSDTYNYSNNDSVHESLLDVDQLLEDISQSQSISSYTELMKNAVDTNNRLKENSSDKAIKVRSYATETKNFVDDNSGNAAEIQFLLDKNNYRSQLTMEKFRYVKRMQDRAFGNLKKYFSKYVENFNINGRLVMQELEHEAREATNNLSDDNDDVECSHFFLHKTVRFKKRVIVREYLPTASISEHMYKDTIYRLTSEEKFACADLNRPRTYDHLLNVDGANDSSDDEKSCTIPKKRAKFISKKPSYKSLPLVCAKVDQLTYHTSARDISFPPEISKSVDEAIKTEKFLASTTEIYSPQPTCNNNPNISTVCDKTTFSAAKRKLTFQEIDLDKTIIEESTSCRYKSKTFVQNANFISIDSIDKPCDYMPVLGKTIAEENNSSDDLFSDEDIVQAKQYLTKSDRYDIETNYVPKAGTSAMKSSGEISQVTSQASIDLDTVAATVLKEECYSKHVDTPTSDVIVFQNNPQLEFTHTYSNENCRNCLSLRDITTIKNEDLDHTLTETGRLTKHLSIYKSSPKVNYKETANGFCELVPKYKPPTQEYIQSSMTEFNIPFVRTVLPFYGNITDVTGPVEVGMQLLYIRGKSAEYLSDFHEDIDAFAKAASNFSKTLNPDRKFTSRELTNLKMSFFGNEISFIETIRKPPSKADINLWLKQNWSKNVNENKQNLRINESSGLTNPTCLKYNHVVKNTISTDISNNNNSKIYSNEDISRNLSSSNDVNCSEALKYINLEYNPNRLVNVNTSIKKNPLNKILNEHQDLLQNKIMKDTSVANCRSIDNSCQITGASLNNTHGFQMSLENLQDARAVHEHQYLTVIVMELHVQTRGDFKPNPELDAVCAIFFAIFNDAPSNDGVRLRQQSGLFSVNTPPINASQFSGLHLNGAGVPSCIVKYYDDEISLINGFVVFLHEYDPDILVGYEIQMMSWGYLIERGTALGINLYPLLSRIEEPTPTNREKHEDAFGDLYITGRIVLDLWRILKHEIALQSYTFENIVYHILHQRVPLHSFRDLTNWWNHSFPSHRHKTVEYYLYRVKTSLQLIDQLDLIGRTSEMARLFGILFYEVLSRGSQFRVESMMLRLAKPLKYIAVSPSVRQRATMRAPEFLPLILEPESKLYTDPVIVLDFQSLYPSMIIAYNYCFSSCIGRVEYLGNDSVFEFGATQLKIPRRKVWKLLTANQLNFSPCGVAFVTAEVRQGILPRMLEEILDTRLMVKKSMKMHKNNKTLQRILHSRQLGLKLIANVTYGYTAANFSGRMPAVEVGDSVVAKGRETLHRAIKLVESHPTWKCRVIYGDTDSLFVLVQGRDRAEAFRIGSEIAEAVTAANPSPVRLKLEKVYQPCILQTKKRYVGYMYETPDQNAPVYEAKGIETVRRDGCPAVTKMLEKCIRILFDSRDVSQIKKYVLRQFSKIVSARASIQDLTFAKEYRGASGYRPSACVPALELTRKWIAIDKRNEPRNGERVPYVIINGPPGIPLIRMVRSPRELLLDDSLKPNALYYITRVIVPPINRCFKLIGADLHQWFNEMPRKQYKYLPTSSPNKGKKSTISQYFTTINCATCDQQTRDGFCIACYMQPQRTSFILHEKIRTLELSYHNTLKICENCTGRKTDIQCISLDCPVLFRHMRNNRDLQQSNFIRELVCNLPRLEDF